MKDMHFTSAIQTTSGGRTAQLTGEGEMVVRPLSALHVKVQVAILGYHHIGQAPQLWYSWYYISEDVFAGQLRFLADGGWQLLDHAALLEGLLPRASASPRCLTGINDGGEPEAMICSWEDLRELERHGVSSQSHSASHRAFSELNPAPQEEEEEEEEEEVRPSKHTLEDALGKPVEIFSFPFGDDGCDASQVEGLLGEAGYRAACLYIDELNPLPIGNPYRLERLAMGPETDLPRVLAQAAGEYRASLRRWPR